MENQLQSVPRDRQSAALDHWQWQQDAPLPEAWDQPDDAPEPRWPSGWWLLPSVALSVPGWFMIVRWLLG